MPCSFCSELYSQSQARLVFVTTLGMDNFDCTKMNAHFKKFTACLWEGLIHEWKQALLAPPLPLMSLNNSRFCSTHNSLQLSCLLQRSTNDTLRILVKAQPSTQTTGVMKICTPRKYGRPGSAFSRDFRHPVVIMGTPFSTQTLW